MTCKEVINEEVKNRYQRAAGFLPVDGEAALEEIDMVKKLENADSEMDLFAGLYRIDAARETDDEAKDTDNESEADIDSNEFEGESRLQGPHSDGHRCQPPTVPDAWLALEDLTRFLHPQSQKQKGYKAENKPCKTALNPVTLSELEDIRSFLWQYCDFDADGKPQNLSAGIWIKASVDIASSRTKGSWQVQTLHASTRVYIQTREIPTHNYRNPRET